MDNKCDGQCANKFGKCPNVKPYPDGSKRSYHTAVKCPKCGEVWSWGMSWDGSKDDEGAYWCQCKNKDTFESISAELEVLSNRLKALL